MDAFLALGALAGLLCLAFPDVIFRGRTLRTSAYLVGVMGVEAPYRYRGAVPRFDGYLIDPWASAWQWEPMTAKAGALYLKGRLPLWNAGQGFGIPLAANMHSSVYYLPALPLLLAPTPLAWDAYLLARLLAAGILTYAFGRLVGLGRLGATAAGAAFMLSSHFMLFVNESWLNVDVLLPALLLAIEKIVRGGGRWWVLCLAMIVHATVTGGMPESTFVVLLFAGGYATWRLTGSALRRERWKTGPIHAVNLLVGTVLGLGTSGFLLIPFAEYVRHGWHLHHGGHGLVHLPLGQLSSILMPYTLGPPWGPLAPARLGAFFYSGVVLPTFGIVAILARRDKGAPVMWFFLLAALLGVMKAYGIAINWTGSWPLFNRVYFARYGSGVIAFSLAVWGGFGLNAISRAQVTARNAILATIVIQATCVALALHVVWRAGTGGNFKYLTPALLLSVGLLTVLQASLLFLGNEEARRNAAAACCMAAMLVELLYLAPPQGGRARRHPVDVAPPAVDYVRQDAEPYRVFALDGILYPDTSSYFALNDIRALDALYPSRYMRYIKEFLNERIVDRFTGEEPMTSCGNVWFDLLGVRYVFAAKSRVTPPCSSDSPPLHVAPQYALVWGGNQRTDKDLNVYRNTRAFPRAFVVHSVEPVSDGDAAIRRMKSGGFDPRRMVVVEALSVADAALLGRTEPAEAMSPAEVVTYEDSRVELRTVTSAVGVLILTDILYPGWSASLDGKPVPIYPANYAFRGVVLTPGRHLIEFAYRPTSFVLGSAVSVISLLFLLGFVYTTDRLLGGAGQGRDHTLTHDSVGPSRH
jgi:hypothetical protein